MNHRTRLILLSVLAALIIAGGVSLLIRNMPSFLAAEIEPIPTPGSRAASKRPPRQPKIVHQIPQEVVGIGVAIRIDTKDGALRITKVISNSPAFHAGLQKEWAVEKIDGQPALGMPLRDCVDRLRGVIGSKVRLELTSPDFEQTNVVELTRQRLEL